MHESRRICEQNELLQFTPLHELSVFCVSGSQLSVAQLAENDRDETPKSRFTQIQSDASLAPLSWGQYVGGIILYFNQTGSSSRCAAA